LRALGLKGDAATANVKIRKWLRDKANTRVHGTIVNGGRFAGGQERS